MRLDGPVLRATVAIWPSHQATNRSNCRQLDLFESCGGGAGCTRTSDNAIMSRALYHLSYGTAQRMLSGGLRPCLQLALLSAVLGDRHPLPLVQTPSHETEPGDARLLIGHQLVAEVGFEPTTFGL